MANNDFAQDLFKDLIPYVDGHFRTIDKPSELASALEEAVREPGPYLLNVKVSPFENVYPMVPAGGAINEMVLAPPQPVAVPK